MNADRCSDVRSDPCVVLRSLSCFGIRPGAQRLVWKRMRSGDRPGLQNRRAAGLPVAGGFDPHSLPPFFNNNTSHALPALVKPSTASFSVGNARKNGSSLVISNNCRTRGVTPLKAIRLPDFWQLTYVPTREPSPTESM